MSALDTLTDSVLILLSLEAIMFAVVSSFKSSNGNEGEEELEFERLHSKELVDGDHDYQVKDEAANHEVLE